MEPTAARTAIQHALVARGSTVLAEFSVVPTHERAIAHQILEKIPAATSDGNNYFCYAHDRYVYHVKRTDGFDDVGGLTVLCMAEDSVGRTIPCAFLQDIHSKFIKAYGKRDDLHMNEEFSRVLSQQMDHYSNSPNTDAVNRVLAELNEVRHILLENIEKMLERGEKLEVLVHKTECIRDQNFRSERQAHRFKRRNWWWRIF